jgi:Domain of unknown function (DUF4112)
MPQTISQLEKALPASYILRLNRIRLLSHLLDEQFRLPGTKYRVGLDGLLGLIPGIGDAVGALLSAYILYEAIKLGVPRLTLARMVVNIGLDAVIGAIPLAGDVFDILWKANKKNLALLHAHLVARHHVARR